ncbi:hypothetical protein OS122_27030 [Mycolicibacterium mucogenicum]|jgi:hypothetical protein|uniref:hypothetical protein n=1 Tax=Mycolicibacterium mucogenicum TaxID=56689 RepID=UPI0022699F08|nr:hypothetical protein [Mycolicibacterium mucogenicum]MCX8564542.1 hypothetical protein [Mycolicibacterium mucogenicum]
MRTGIVHEIPAPLWVAPETGVDWRTVVEATATVWHRPSALRWTADVDQRGAHHRSERYDISEQQPQSGLPKYVLTGYGLDFRSGSVDFLKSVAAGHYDRMTRRQRWSGMSPHAALGDHCEPPLWMAGSSIAGRPL